MNTSILERARAYYSFRYLWARARLGFYEKRSPELPWMPRSVNAFLDCWLSSFDIGFEFGSGRSTLWLAKRVETLISVESDEAWWSEVEGRLKKANCKNVELLFKSVLPRENPVSSPYVLSVDEFPDSGFDFVIVDGKHRAHCAIRSIPKIRQGGILIIDDVHRYLPSPSSVPHARPLAAGYGDETWHAFAEVTHVWRRAIFTDGVTDTGIFWKPCGQKKT